MSGRTPSKGRGAQSNRSSRYSHYVINPVIENGPDISVTASRKTISSPDNAKSALTYNQSPDIPFDRSVNPYRGCEHGCVYCFARPGHAYLDLSPGLDFESRLFYKAHVATILKNELQKPNYHCDTIALSPNTDCYQPLERRLGLTRQILDVLNRCHHPVSIITKSALVLRDMDLLVGLAERNLVSVLVSVTTLDPRLSARLEPRASAPHRRLQIIEKLSEAGIPTGVLFAPLIPFINDNEIESILDTCQQRGARSASYVLLRLPLEVKDLWIEWLHTHYPDRAKRVMKILHDTREGKAYDPTFGKRMTGSGVYADLISKRFNLASKRIGLSRRSEPLDKARFDPQLLSDQLRLFD